MKSIVLIDDGYKIDQNNGDFDANIINCTSCSRGARMAAVENDDANNVINKKQKVDNSQMNTDINQSKLIFNLAPNPNNGTFNLTTNGAVTNITVTNILGEVVFKTQSTITDTEINLNNTKGIYFVTVKGEGINDTKKVIIEVVL